MFSDVGIGVRMIATGVGRAVERPGEGQAEGVQSVEVEVGIIVDEVFFGNELDFIPDVEGVFYSEHGGAEIRVGREATALEPAASGAVHGGSHIGVALAGVVVYDTGDGVLGAELDFPNEEALVSALVHHTAAYAATIDEDAIRPPLGEAAEDLGGQFGGA